MDAIARWIESLVTHPLWALDDGFDRADLSTL
jgi:hypothetical protein